MATTSSGFTPLWGSRRDTSLGRCGRGPRGSSMDGLRDLRGGSALAAVARRLAAAGRVVSEGERIFATEATRDPKTVLRGRLEALGPVFSDDPLFAELEADGTVLRARIDGRWAWCDRRLLARIHRYTLDRLRREIELVTASQFLRFLARREQVDPADPARGTGRRRPGARDSSPAPRCRRRAGKPAGRPRAARLSPRLARPGDALRRADVGAALERGRRTPAPDADRVRASRPARAMDRARCSL